MGKFGVFGFQLPVFSRDLGIVVRRNRHAARGWERRNDDILEALPRGIRMAGQTTGKSSQDEFGTSHGWIPV